MFIIYYRLLSITDSEFDQRPQIQNNTKGNGANIDAIVWSMFCIILADHIVCIMAGGERRQPGNKHCVNNQSTYCFCSN